jgi:hypothetical protein
MMPPHLQQLEEKVRYAAACRRYMAIGRLASEFAEAVRAYAQTLPKGDPRAAQAGRKVIDLFSWALVMVQGERAACATELRRVTAATRYSRRAAEPARAAGIQLDA